MSQIPHPTLLAELYRATLTELSQEGLYLALFYGRPHQQRVK
jgi:hypothetical protein